MTINEFLKADTEKLEELIEKYPQQIPVAVASELMGVDPNNLRQAIQEGNLGISWRKPGKLNRGFCIPTGKFVRWWLNDERCD